MNYDKMDFDTLLKAYRDKFGEDICLLPTLCGDEPLAIIRECLKTEKPYEPEFEGLEDGVMY